MILIKRSAFPFGDYIGVVRDIGYIHQLTKTVRLGTPKGRGK